MLSCRSPFPHTFGKKTKTKTNPPKRPERPIAHSSSSGSDLALAGPVCRSPVNPVWPQAPGATVDVIPLLGHLADSVSGSFQGLGGDQRVLIAIRFGEFAKVKYFSCDQGLGVSFPAPPTSAVPAGWCWLLPVLCLLHVFFSGWPSVGFPFKPVSVVGMSAHDEAVRVLQCGMCYGL